MDFLGIGAEEIILIIILAILIWGPRRIIEIGRSLGKTVRAFKQATSDIVTQVNRELQEEKKDPRWESRGESMGGRPVDGDEK